MSVAMAEELLEKCIRALSTMSPEQDRELQEYARKVLSEEVPIDDQGHTMTNEALIVRQCMKAARHPGIPREVRNKAFRMAKEYVARTTPPVVIEVKLDELRDKETQ